MSAWEELAEGERLVVDLACTGMTDAEIASRLHVEAGQVAATLSAVAARVGCGSRTELVVAALTRR